MGRTKPRSTSVRTSAAEPTSAASPAVENERPITAAARSASFAGGSRRSIRAASTPWMESGIVSAPASSAHPPLRRVSSSRSRRSDSTSSTKNGFPSAWRTTSSRASASRGAASARSISSPASSSPSGSRINVSPAGSPERPGRVVPRISTGPVASDSTRASSSISGSVAQCRSSSTTTAGPRAPMSDTRRTHASWSASTAARGSRSPATSSPRVSPRISLPAIFSSAGSSSRRPSSCLSTSASGLYVTLRP